MRMHSSDKLMHNKLLIWLHITFAAREYTTFLGKEIISLIHGCFSLIQVRMGDKMQARRNDKEIRQLNCCDQKACLVLQPKELYHLSMTNKTEIFGSYAVLWDIKYLLLKHSAKQCSAGKRR